MAGREAEYELLRIAIRGSVTPDGPSSLVLVEGDAGVGKTWLTDAVIGDLPGHPTVLRVVAAESETVIELARKSE